MHTGFPHCVTAVYTAKTLDSGMVSNTAIATISVEGLYRRVIVTVEHIRGCPCEAVPVILDISMVFQLSKL